MTDRVCVLLLAALVAGCSDKHESSRASRLEQPPFVCDGAEWVQRHPRLPDDGEWSCNDTGGAAVCVGGDAPAGVPKNVRDPAWSCGPRRTVEGRPTGERVCVHASPDLPADDPRGWSCRYTADNGVHRVCRRDLDAHRIGDRCDTDHPCLDGLLCSATRCTLEPSTPTCAFDRDCAGGACRFGTCREEGVTSPAKDRGR